MDTGKRRSQRDYTLAFKLSVVDEVEKCEVSYKEAQRRFGIQGRGTVLVWLRTDDPALIPPRRILAVEEPNRHSRHAVQADGGVDALWYPIDIWLDAAPVRLGPQVGLPPPPPPGLPLERGGPRWREE